MQRPLTFQRSTLALCVALAAAGAAIAEETDLGTITVYNETYRSTATKTALEPEETPQGISVVEQDAIEEQGASSVEEALRYVPGIASELRGGGVKMVDTYTIRGFETNGSYYDGLPLHYVGWNLMPQIDTAAVQQIEVFKGPTSVLYGAMPPGGMVNIIAKSPQEEASTSIGFASGSHNLLEGTVDTTGQIGDSNFYYRLVAKAKQKESQVDTADEERYMIAPSVDWQATDKTLVNFNLYYQNDPDMGIYTTMPLHAVLTDSELGSTSPSTYSGDDNWSTFEREVLMAGFKINHEINKNWTFLQKVRGTNADFMQENTYLAAAANYDESTGTLIRNIYKTDEQIEGIALDNQLSGKFNTAGAEHNVLIGVDYQYVDSDIQYLEYSTTDSAFYDFNILNADNELLDRDTLSSNYEQLRDISLSQTGVYLQDQLTWDKLVVIAGLRIDWYEAEDEKVVGSEITISEAEDEELSYRLGTLYKFENGMSPFVSYATSFEPQVGINPRGGNYNPELSKQFEVGANYTNPNNKFAGNFSVFHITKEDALVANPSGAYDPKLQIGEMVSKGVEIDATWYPTEQIDVTAAYTYTNMEITKAAEGTTVEGTKPVWLPEHSASLWANYNFYDGVLSGSRWGAGVRYIGEMQLNASNTDKVPDYTLFDFSVSYDLGEAITSMDGASATIAVNNLLDEEYYTCYDDLNCWYGAERTVKVSLDYTF